MQRVGVISDTHGLVRPEAARALHGCDSIIHAGDVTDPEVLETLRAIAPLTAVRGNNDRGAWAAGLATSELMRIEDVHIYVIHDLQEIEIDPPRANEVLVTWKAAGLCHSDEHMVTGDMVPPDEAPEDTATPVTTNPTTDASAAPRLNSFLIGDRSSLAPAWGAHAHLGATLPVPAALGEPPIRGWCSEVPTPLGHGQTSTNKSLPSASASRRRSPA